MVSLVVEHGLQQSWLRALEHNSVVALWRAGSPQTRDRAWVPALAGGFFTTEPLGKPFCFFFLFLKIVFFLMGFNFVIYF